MRLTYCLLTWHSSPMEPSAKKLSITYSLADQSFAGTKSIGILNVSVGLLQALGRRPECARLTAFSNHSLLERFASSDGTKIEYQDRATDRGLGRVWWDQVGVYSAAKRTGNEWLFLPKGFASFTSRCPVRLATFVHDVMQEHYDRHYPNAIPGYEAAYFRAGLRASLQHSEVIFTPSDFTLKEITRVAKEKGWRVPQLVCCGEGVDRSLSAPLTERRDIVVLTSQFPHKLTQRAVEFLDRWCRENPFAETVHWIGSLPEKMEMPSRPNWRRHAILPEPEFRTLIGHARAVLSFSDYEGFGRPPVEAALAGGCPVYSNIAASREVMGDCGYSFENGNYETFATALRQGLAVGPEQLQAWENKLAARHNWETVAKRVVTALSTASEPVGS